MQVPYVAVWRLFVRVILIFFKYFINIFHFSARGVYNLLTAPPKAMKFQNRHKKQKFFKTYRYFCSYPYYTTKICVLFLLSFV